MNTRLKEMRIRAGYKTAQEFADHKLEKSNILLYTTYIYLVFY